MAFKVAGVITEKKEKTFQRNEVEETNYSIIISCLGFNLPYELDYNDWVLYKEGEVVQLLVAAKNSSKVVDKKAYNFFEPLVRGIKKAKLNDILHVPKGELCVLDAQLLSLGFDEKGEEKGSYAKILFEGDLVGEMTGSKELFENLQNYKKYSCNMSIAIKRNVLQIIPTNFKEIGVLDEEF